MYKFYGVGRIVRNAETRTVEIGDNKVKTLVTDVDIAANEGFGEKQTTIFVRVSLWREPGAKLAPSLTKGRIVSFNGVPGASAWIDREGKAHARLELKKAEIQLLDKKPGDPAEAAVAPEVDNETPFTEE